MAELQHEMTIGASPLAAARIQAAAIHGDIETGQTEMPGAHVRYEDEPGKDQSLSPRQLNEEGKGNCASIPRAVAPFVDASHVGVVPVPQKDGGVVHHTFLIKDAAPGDAPIHIGPDGRALSPIPPERIIDPNVGHGMNGGQPLPPAVYQGAALAPIAPPGVPDLSHVHADPADRAAEGKSHQGAPTLHAPTTEKGAHVAVASNLAARNVDPHPTAEPRPVEELYPAHPAEAKADREHGPLPNASRRQVAQYASGLQAVAAGRNPAPLPDDPPVAPEHREAAAALLDHVKNLANAQVTKAPPAEKAVAIEALTSTTERLKTADRSDPEHDAHATIVAEVERMLPGMTPPHVAEHIPRAPAAPPAPRASHRELDLFSGADDGELAFFFFDGADRGGAGLDLTMSVAVTVALCHEHLRRWRVGCPGDGNRCERPARRTLDRRMGAIGEMFREGHEPQEWREHRELVERRRREHERGAREFRDRHMGDPRRREFEHRREFEPRRDLALGEDPRRARMNAEHEVGPRHADRRVEHAEQGHHQHRGDEARGEQVRWHDRRIGALGMGWHGRDRYLVGNQSWRLKRAINAYNTNPMAHATLDNGGRVFGISLAEIQMAKGVPQVIDPMISGGFHGGGMGHGRGGGQGFGAGSFGSALLVGDGDDIDPSMFDPMIAGTGTGGSSGASSSGSSRTPASGSSGAPASGSSGASRTPASGSSGAPASPTGSGSSGASRTPGSSGSSGASRAPASGSSGRPIDPPRPEERRPEERHDERRPEERHDERRPEERHDERIAARVAERHWRDRWGKDRTGPIIAAEWEVDREHRHWRDRWGKIRFEPIILDEFEAEVDAPPVDVSLAVPELYRPRHWWERFFHWPWGHPHHRDIHIGAVHDEDDHIPGPRRNIRCACP